MTTIYLIRHGQSMANLDGVFNGHLDTPLSEHGHYQATLTAEYLKNIKVDAIYSSDLIRAYQTACHTGEVVGLPVIKDEKLREISGGDWEGVHVDDLCVKFKKNYDVWRNDIGNSRCDNGESVAELLERIVTEVRRIAEENDGKTVFIFTHATPVRVFASYCLKKTLSEMKDIPWCSNAAVTKVLYDGEFELVDYGIDSFLKDAATYLSENA